MAKASRSARTEAAASGYQVRSFPVHELRVAGEAEAPHITGHAAVFNSLSEPLGWFMPFRELILPGAFKNSIAAGDDVRALFNHDSNYVLGRTKNKTLSLREDEVGLAIDATPLNTQTIRDLVLEPIKRGDVDQMSFGFEIVSDDWRMQDGEEIHELLEVRLFDVSPVTFPAYTATDVQARAMRRLAGAARMRSANEILRQSTDDAGAAGTIAQIDALADDLDELVDTLMDQMGIADPDEAGEPEENTLRKIVRIRSSIATLKRHVPGGSAEAGRASRATPAAAESSAVATWRRRVDLAERLTA